MYHYSLPNIFLYILGANQREGMAIQLVWVKRLGGKRLEAKKTREGNGFTAKCPGFRSISEIYPSGCLPVCLSQTYVALVKSITCSEYQFYKSLLLL